MGSPEVAMEMNTGGSKKTAMPVFEKSYSRMEADKFVIGHFELATYGPLIDVTIAHRDGSTDRSGRAMIDTGTSVTFIDEEAARELGLPMDEKPETSPTFCCDSASFNIYRKVDLKMEDFPTIQLDRVLAGRLATNPNKLLAIIGRDILKRGTFKYDGLQGRITLTLGPSAE